MVSRKIRVGIIRCDTHAYWYASLFERPDPDVFRRVHRGRHYYFYDWADPSRPRVKVVPGMTIAKVFDEERRSLAEGLSEAYRGRPKVCDSYEEVSDDVDLVYVADCDYEGKDHLRLATPGLKKGVPHFVDKPFAFTLADAAAIVSLAKRHKTAVMCASLLGQSPYLRRFKIRFADIAPVGSVHVPCDCGKSLAGVVHGLSVVQNVMGEGCEWVESMGPELYDVTRLHYPIGADGVEVVVSNASGCSPGRKLYAFDYPHAAFGVSAYGAGGAIHSPTVDDYLFPHGGIEIVKMARRMAQTRKPPIAYGGMLEPMRMIEALRLAHKTGERVYLKELSPKA